MSSQKISKSSFLRMKKEELVQYLPQEFRGKTLKKKEIVDILIPFDRKTFEENENISEDRFLNRMDIFRTLFLKRNEMKEEELFQYILSDKKNNPISSRQGFLFETLCILLMMTKCLPIEWNEILEGPLSNLKPIKNSKELLEKKINQGGNDSDITLKNGKTIIPFSIKYTKKISKKKSDISILENQMRIHYYNDYKIGLIIKDTIQNSHDKESSHFRIFEKIKEDELFFTEKDIKKGIKTFQEKFSSFRGNFSDFIEMINSDFLGNHRVLLIKKLHQKMTEMKVLRELEHSNRLCIYQKTRSGKTILSLSILQQLLDNFGYQKILILTSITQTIDSFIKTLEKFIDFRNINYKRQDEFLKIKQEWKGIMFSSVQYLKMDSLGRKKKQLFDINFDVVLIDESHYGSSNKNTNDTILSYEEEDRKIMDSIYKKYKKVIFMSATAMKTIQYYKISSSSIFEWTYHDEKMMQNLSKDDNYKRMTERHGDEFKICYHNQSFNKDYSTTPTQVYLKWEFAKSLEEKIRNYNIQNRTDYGFDCKSLFALYEEFDEETKLKKYRKEFQLSKTDEGKEILREFLDSLLSNDPMKETMMKEMIRVQTEYKSRKSTRENPLLFIFYLPTHTRNGTIDLLLETLVKFLKENHLWTDYQIEYSCGKLNSNNTKEEYNDFIESCMNRTREYKKKGCILFLGQQGTIGITYDFCDVTISLDDGHSIDIKYQRDSRANTPAEGKTISINVDLNIHRYYHNMYFLCHEFRKKMKIEKENRSILQYFFENKYYLFSPQEINFGKWTTSEIQSYYKNESRNMISYIVDDETILEGIECNDELREEILNDFHYKKYYFQSENPDLNGNNPDFPRPGRERYENEVENSSNNPILEEENNEIIEEVNKTLELAKSFFPLLALLSRENDISFEEMLDSDIFQELIISFLQEKIEFKNFKKIIYIMKKIIQKNSRIIKDIRELYRSADGKKLRSLVGKHFIPSVEEKKKNAEIPTPVKLVDEMLQTIPPSFWRKKRKVLEPCCGKGNFILGIFDLFFKGLRRTYRDKEERCRVIIEECLYYCDISPINVFITTELLKCHIEMYCGKRLNIKFHSYVGDTLKLNPKKVWKVEGFDAVIGNPPYNQPKLGKLIGGYGGRSLWDKFIVISLDKFLEEKGFLLFINPPSWRKPDHYLWKKMTQENQLLYLKMFSKKEGKKIFQCSTLIDYFLLEKTPSYKKTMIDGQDKKQYEIDLKKWDFLPSGEINMIKKMLGTGSVIYSSSLYDPRRQWILPQKKDETKEDYYKRAEENGYLYPIIHNMTKEYGNGYVFSNEKKGHFGEKKVVLSFGEFQYPYNDYKGEYGMSQICFGIPISSKKEGDNICKAINSNKFKLILQYTKWSTFLTDWRMFKYFKKDWYKQFI